MKTSRLGSAREIAMNEARRTLSALVRRPPPSAWAAGAALLVLFLLGWAVVTADGLSLDTPMGQALAGGTAAAAATAVGALPALFLRRISAQWEDVMLGFAAGVMLAASAFSLIVPGIDAADRLYDTRAAGAALVGGGLLLGALALLLADKVLPHEHAIAGRHGPRALHVRRIWLLVFAIALHNAPEGMAIGVGFSDGDASVGIPLAAAIALQDIPEGLVVAVALRAVAYPPWKAVAIAALTGLAEPAGAAVGVLLTHGFAALYPAGLGFAAGAMIWVVSHEIIPETHRKGHAQPATLGLIGGFIVMMLLDTAFA
jgi:ZIP family zinc transporter